MDTIDKKTWSEFRETGLVWFVNSILHLFGWAIVLRADNGEILEVYPARVTFRGFSEGVTSEGYRKVTKWFTENAEDLYKESEMI